MAKLIAPVKHPHTLASPSLNRVPVQRRRFLRQWFGHCPNRRLLYRQALDDHQSLLPFGFRSAFRKRPTRGQTSPRLRHARCDKPCVLAPLHPGTVLQNGLWVGRITMRDGGTQELSE